MTRNIIKSVATAKIAKTDAKIGLFKQYKKWLNAFS